MAAKYEYCIFMVKNSREKFLGQYKGRWLEGLTIEEAKEYLEIARKRRKWMKWVIGRREITEYGICDDNGKPIEEGK